MINFVLILLGMMPLWIFTLGQLIFQEGRFGVPYSRIAGFAVGLVIPLAIGFLIQKYLPRLSKIMTRILKPFSAILILFIVIFAIVTNLYLFKLFTWQVSFMFYSGFLIYTTVCEKCNAKKDTCV
jgi:Sodium Bile acid symporter family.